MRYAEYPAPQDLNDSIRCVWIFEASFDDAHDERIVPDGCPEIILHFGAPYRQFVSTGRWRNQPPLLLAGNLTRPLVLRAEGKVGVLGIRLWPHAVSRFTGNDPVEALDSRLPLRHRDIHFWRKRLAHASDAERLQVVPAIVSSLSREPFAPDNAVAWAVAEVFASRGQVDPARLAQGTQLSLRQLERRMKVATGLSLKLLASLVRFRAVFDELKAEVPSPWLTAALGAGYFDQAHMIRDFKRFAGQPPRAFLANAGPLSTSIVSAVTR
ncbi:MAG: AraC family transcriptional regulator [Betaproteobacteria bacterium]|nr:AraC family transcriptional regulator [Betaproteobacteria bacterium]